jgi:hypothetical protein
MIIDHRTYVTKHGRLQEFLDRYEKMALGVQQEYLGRLVGYFVTDIGLQNQVVHLWAYDSLADRDERRGRMEKDPAWTAFKQANAGVFKSQENKILKPVHFSPIK